MVCNANGFHVRDGLEWIAARCTNRLKWVGMDCNAPEAPRLHPHVQPCHSSPTQAKSSLSQLLPPTLETHSGHAVLSNELPHRPHLGGEEATHVFQQDPLPQHACQTDFVSSKGQVRERVNDPHHFADQVAAVVVQASALSSAACSLSAASNS